ncbi:MAG: CHAT domain-containing protein, partial [Acidobacteriota bacterium]|nr:CHAT domain-containing protein [Acidobacteriota bacterium]
LWEMPFQALLDEQNKYAVDKYEISFAPSLSVMRGYRDRAQRPRQTPGKLLAVGRPVVTPEPTKISLSIASETEREVRAVAGLYGATESKLLTGSNANEAAFRDGADRYRTIHLATHGVIDDARPLDSYLQLAPSQKDDGRLRAREVMNLSLNADLAVLSACESARGKISRGEGVIGMSWAFHIAGVPTTVVSQWKVDSKSTEELMVEFHRQLLGGVGKARSLKSAVLKLKQDRRYSHPFYWASFVIVGDAD